MDEQQAIQDLIDRGVGEGCVELSDVDDLVQRLGLDEAAEARLLSTLDERRIEVRDDCGREGVAATSYANGQLAEATTDALGQLLQEVGRYRLLTASEEVELFQRIEQGDEEARDRMVLSNLRLVISIARRFQGQGLPLLDLIQEGVLGLMRAIDKFEWQRGYKFSTYATFWIRQALQRGVGNRAREIRIPLHVADRERRMSRVEQRLAVELGRPPTDQELAEGMGISSSEIEDLRKMARTVTSLDRPVGDEEDGTNLGQLMPSPQAGPDQEVTIRLSNDALLEALNDLPDLEQAVLRRRYGMDGGEPQTLQAVARELGIGVSRVRTLERNALDRLAMTREVRALRDVA